MGLAFADQPLQRDASAHIVLVDRRAKPGGHWNDANEFVSLHQPAAYYGVKLDAARRRELAGQGRRGVGFLNDADTVAGPDIFMPVGASTATWQPSRTWCSI